MQSIQANARLPAYCTGIGKALLAFQPLAEIDAVLARPLAAVTASTIADRVTLYEALADIRLKGYAMDNEENEEGLSCIARPLFNYSDEVVGAISVAGPTPRMLAKMDEVGEALAQVSALVSQRLGHLATKKSR